MEVINSLFKEQVYQQCLDAVNDRIQQAEYALLQAREASQDETKSSAGDKYETTREMMQQDIDRNTSQLYEARKLLFQLEQCKDVAVSESVVSGSLIKTSRALLYLAVGIGQLKVDKQSLFALSPASPLGQLLMGKKVGDELNFNGTVQRIEAIC
jgi:transcription elongation GreA/GreB family factor